jgi:hypothetical protein
MALLEESKYIEVLKNLDDCQSPWLLAAYQESSNPARSLQGILGVIDWRLHGLLSDLIKKQRLEMDELAIIPGQARLGKASLLVHYCGLDLHKSEKIVDSLKKLHCQEICLVETSFPADFLRKLKQNLSKAGIKCLSLDPIT